MAGWDEGNVFYSDQQLEDNDVNVADAATRHTAQRKFKEFIRSFGDVKGPFPYRFVLCISSMCVSRPGISQLNVTVPKFSVISCQEAWQGVAAAKSECSASCIGGPSQF